MDLLRNLGILAALSLAVAACGGDEDSDDTIDSDSDTVEETDAEEA